MTTRATELLGCRYPVIQGAMGVISNPELVAAVTPTVDKINCGEFEAGDAFCRSAFEKSWIRGHLDAGLLPVGQSAGLVRSISSAKAVIKEMVFE